MTEGFDPQALLSQALQMQQRMAEAQAEAASESVEGAAGGGRVRVTMTGAGEVTAVRIDPSVVVPDEVDLLEDLIVAALRDAATKAADLAERSLGLGGLGELLGGEEGGLAGLLEGMGGTGIGGLLGGGGYIDVDEALPPDELPGGEPA